MRDNCKLINKLLIKYNDVNFFVGSFRSPKRELFNGRDLMFIGIYQGRI